MKTRSQQDFIPSSLSPEEHEAAYGQRCDGRVKVWRQTYGPGQHPSGARFRNEVTVCTSCGHVIVSSACPGSRCHQTDPSKLVRRSDVLDRKALRPWMPDAFLKQLVPAPCNGLRIPPVVEAGYFWL